LTKEFADGQKDRWAESLYAITATCITKMIFF